MSEQSVPKKNDAAPADEGITVICFPGKAPPVALGQLEVQMQNTPGVEFKRTQTIQGATALALKSKKVVAIICLGDKAELVSAINFLATLHARVVVGTVRVMVVSKIAHPKVPHMLKSKGASEVVEFTVTVKALSFKINTSLKLVHQAYEKKLKNDAKPIVHKGSIVGGGKAAASKIALSGAKDAGAEIVWENAAENANDVWLINSKKDVRCVLGRWLVHMVGPGPSVGTFEPSTLTFEGEKGWEWQLRKGKGESFIKDDGKWVFFGRQPEFLWQKNMWSFVSNHPTLGFYVGKEVSFYRMVCEKGNKLIINENSARAKALLPSIKETIEMSVRFKNENGAKKSQDDQPIYEDENSSSVEGALSDEDILGMGENSGGAPSEAIDEVLHSGGGLLDSQDDNNPDDLDWSGVPKKQERAPAPVVDKEVDDYVNEYSEQVALSKSGTPWKQGKDAFAEITLEFLVKSKNGAELIKPETLNLLESQNLEAVMDAAEGQFKVGDEVLLLVRLVDGDSANEFDVSAKVDRFEGNPEEGRHVTVIKMDQENFSMLEEILKLYVQRQEELTEFFQTAKGA